MSKGVVTVSEDTVVVGVTDQVCNSSGNLMGIRTLKSLLPHMHCDGSPGGAGGRKEDGQSFVQHYISEQHQYSTIYRKVHTIYLLKKCAVDIICC